MKVLIKDLAVGAFFLASMIAKLSWWPLWAILLVAYAGVRLAGKSNNEV